MTPGSLLVFSPFFEKYQLVISLSSLELRESYRHEGIFEATALFPSSARKMFGGLNTNDSSYKTWRLLSHAE